MKKVYVIDTNVLLNDNSSIYSFNDSIIAIPMIVLEEIDRIKNRPDENGRSARQLARILDDLRNEGSLLDGVRLQRTDSIIKISSYDRNIASNMPHEVSDFTKADNAILATAYTISKSGNYDVVLVTKDINLRIKCDSLGIKSEDYTSHRAIDDVTHFYKGYDVLDVESDVIDTLCEIGWSQLDNEYYPNHYLNLRSSDDRSILAKVKDNCSITRIKDVDSAFGLRPRNLEQRFSLDLLFDNNVKLVTLCGASGTGKTLLAVAAGMQQVIESPSKYDRLIITRPVQPVGKDIGYLPGTLQEKMEPWISPIKDNLDQLCRTKKTRKDEPYLDLLIRNKKIEIEAITFIRGRSIPNSFIIIDEAQNLSLHELKTIITRVGDNTKIVLTGDIEQIDNSHVDIYTNGLTYAVESFKQYKISGHLTLTKGERSELATLASKIL